MIQKANVKGPYYANTNHAEWVKTQNPWVWASQANTSAANVVEPILYGRREEKEWGDALHFQAFSKSELLASVILTCHAISSKKAI